MVGGSTALSPPRVLPGGLFFGGGLGAGVGGEIIRINSVAKIVVGDDCCWVFRPNDGLAGLGSDTGAFQNFAIEECNGDVQVWGLGGGVHGLNPLFVSSNVITSRMFTRCKRDMAT